jgi:methionyl-tRNA formyltransferase
VPTRSLRVAIVAEEAAGVQVLRGLAALKPEPTVVAVLTRSRGDGAKRPVVYDVARDLGLDIWPSRDVASPALAERLSRAEVDLLVNIHSLHVIHPTVLATPRIGSFNLHPGPLPEFAGLNVPSWAIYEGETSHAVTLHWMDKGIDTGPLAWREDFAIEDGDTGLSVSAKCVRLGVPLVLKLAIVAAGDPNLIPRAQQDLGRRRYFSAGPPNGGQISWSRPAAEIVRFVRAADYAPFESPWGHPETTVAGMRLGIAKATTTGLPAESPPGSVIDADESGATIAAADELVLVQRVWMNGSYFRPVELLAV